MDASDVEAYLQQLQAQFIEPGVAEGDLAVQSSTDVQQKSKSANEDSEADEDGPTGTLKPDPVDRVRAGLVYRMGTAAGLPGAPPGAVAGLARFLAAAAFLDVRPSSKKVTRPVRILYTCNIRDICCGIIQMYIFQKISSFAYT